MVTAVASFVELGSSGVREPPAWRSHGAPRFRGARRENGHDQHRATAAAGESEARVAASLPSPAIVHVGVRGCGEDRLKLEVRQLGVVQGIGGAQPGEEFFFDDHGRASTGEWLE